MEQAENNIRRDFTPSERVEIARRIEAALTGRVGNPQLRKHLGNSEKGESADIAAKSVGWSGETYRKAKKVIESGDEELKESVDSIPVLQSHAGAPVTAPGPPLPAGFSWHVF